MTNEEFDDLTAADLEKYRMLYIVAGMRIAQRFQEKPIPDAIPFEEVVDLMADMVWSYRQFFISQHPVQLSTAN